MYVINVLISCFLFCGIKRTVRYIKHAKLAGTVLIFLFCLIQSSWSHVVWTLPSEFISLFFSWAIHINWSKCVCQYVCHCAWRC